MALGLTLTGGSMHVEAVDAGELAASLGVCVGDVIMEADGVRVQNSAGLRGVLSKTGTLDSLTVARGRAVLKLTVAGSEVIGELSSPVGVPTVRVSMVTTLQALPGFTIVEHLGPVSVLSGSSGFTATSKGNTALDRAMGELQQVAGGMGANAVVGLTTSSFGAGGGITSVFGGDAVGVLLVGSAVVVQRMPDANPVENPTMTP